MPYLVGSMPSFRCSISTRPSSREKSSALGRLCFMSAIWPLKFFMADRMSLIPPRTSVNPASFFLSNVRNCSCDAAANSSIVIFLCLAHHSRITNNINDVAVYSRHG
jgi:hypothetical protein